MPSHDEHLTDIGVDGGQELRKEKLSNILKLA